MVGTAHFFITQLKSSSSDVISRLLTSLVFSLFIVTSGDLKHVTSEDVEEEILLWFVDGFTPKN